MLPPSSSAFSATPASVLAPRRHSRQTDFDLPENRFLQLVADSGHWRVYDNANFSVHITDKCNADCPFCIAHLRYLNEGLAYVKPAIEDEQRYLERLQQALQLVRPVDPSVSITGGEPTVNKRLPGILRVLANHGVRKRTLTTNATGLQDKVDGGSDTVLDRLVEYRLEHLNISRAHFEQGPNNRLMKMAKHLLPEPQLRESIAEARRRGIRVRLSCVLTQEGIHSLEQMVRYLEWADSLGVDNVIFRQLMDFDRQRVKPGVISLFCERNQVQLPPLWEQMDQDARFRLCHWVLGYYYYVEVREFGRMTVTTEMADLRLIAPQLQKFSQELHAPTAFELVYHPNGNLCAGWNENELIMSGMPDA